MEGREEDEGMQKAQTNLNRNRAVPSKECGQGRLADAM